jgi:hypothetical protein
MKKNRRPKISCYCPFNASFCFPLKQTIVNIVFGLFLKHPEPRKRDDKVGELAGDCRELRNCGSQILKVRNSAIDLAVRNIAELRRCGLKLRMPTFDIYVLYSSSIYVCIQLLILSRQLVNIHTHFLIFCFNVPLKAVGVLQNCLKRLLAVVNDSLL